MTQLISTTSTFPLSRIKGGRYARTDILKGLWYPGATLAQSIVNKRDAAHPMSAVGTPVFPVSCGVVVAGGSGGTNGTGYPLVIPPPPAGGVPAAGTFDVVNNALSAIHVTAGSGYGGPIALGNSAFAACTGLVGASAVLNSLSALLSRTNYFDTGLLNTPSSTFMVVARTPAANAAFMGDYLNSASPTGDQLAYVLSGSMFRHYASAATGAATNNPQLALAGLSASRFRVWGGSVDGNGLINRAWVYDDSGNKITGTPAPLASRGVSARTIHIGWAADTSFVGATEIAGAAFWNGYFATTDDDAGRAMFKLALDASLDFPL
jgi:hypothetical protein